MKRKKNKNACRECGKDGKYYYSRELAKYLGLGLWDGVYFCPKCMAKLSRKYRAETEGEDEGIYSMLV